MTDRAAVTMATRPMATAPVAAAGKRIAANAGHSDRYGSRQNDE
jgi:hypothetical protein